MEKIILKILVFFFLCFSSLEANESIYTVKDNQIYFQNDGKVLELRDKAKNLAFQNAFKILTKKILEPTELRKLDAIGEIDISSLIKDFKIVEEKITDINYSSNISVNFNSQMILDLFDNHNIESKVLVSEEYLVFPVLKKFNTLYLWENDNYWYDFLQNEYDELGLLKLFFPKKNHINKLKISPNQIIQGEIEFVNSFLELYKKKKAIIIFLEENFDLSSNKIKSSVNAKLFSDNKFYNIKFFKEDSYKESSELSNAKLIAKTIINELQEWWKNQIDIIDFESDEEFVFFLKLKANNLKKNIHIENKINKILGSKGFYLHELNNKYITYKILTRYSINQLNLSLDGDDIRLIESETKDHYFIQDLN